MALNEALLILLFTGVFAGILSGMPAMVAIGGVPILIAVFASLISVFDLSLLNALPERISGIINNTLFMAVPLFVFMGVLMERAGLAGRMLGALEGLANKSPSKISLGVLLVSTLVAATTGVVGATIIMLGIVAMPALLRAGVPMRLSSGMVCATGTLGQIIPPSIVLIVLADQISNAHLVAERASGNFSPEPLTVSDLFAASLMPGLLLVLLYAIYILIRLWRVPVKSIVPDAKVSGESHDSLLVLLLPLVLIFLVLGSILLGVATATEAAALGAGGMLLLAVLGNSGDASFWQSVFASLRETTLVSGMIFGIVITASVLSLVFRGLGGDEIIADFLGSMPGDKWGALLLVMAVIFLLGFVLEFIEITFIVIPLVGPVLFAMGFDPLWFAVLVALNLQTSFLTPPFGVALFYFRDVAPKELPTQEIYRSIIPFVCLQLLALLLVALWPQLALWLPQILFGS